MCAVAKVMACQVSYLPLGTDNLDVETDKILEVIRESGLEHSVGALATEVRGPRSELLALIGTMVAVAERESRFVLDVRISNTCGC